VLKAVAAYYDAAAKRYGDKYLKMEYYRTLYRKVGEVLDKYVKPGMSVLDVGAGTGFWTTYMAAKGAHVIALDISAKSLRECKCGDRVAADGESLPARKGRFDAVTALGSVLNHMPDAARAVREASQALRPGGVLIADVDNALCLDMLYEYVLFQGLGKLVEALRRGAVRGVWESADGEIPFTYYTYYYMKKALHSAGLKLVEARPIYLLPLLPSRVLQRDFKTKPLEKLDLLKPLAPLATTVIYVAKKP